MKTTSAWGKTPSRFYKFVKYCEEEYGKEKTVCIVGCSDGKFVFPFLRKDFKVTAIDVDKIALYGGSKIFPLDNNGIKIKYQHSENKVLLPCCETESRNILGLERRAELEKLSSNLNIVCEDFFHTKHFNKYDIVFTSCSFQYKINRDLSLKNVFCSIKDIVNNNGVLYFDYMLPLEDRHTWKSPLFLRKNQVKDFFKEDWKIVYYREMHEPIFEKAHIDRPNDHFHRFGYAMARKNP